MAHANCVYNLWSFPIYGAKTRNDGYHEMEFLTQ